MSMFSTGTELRRFRAGIMPKLALLVVALIPLVYGILYLWAFWNPPAHLNQLPVALVNEDQPAASSAGTVKAGATLERNLIEQKNLDWHVVSAEQARDGVKRGTYYFMVTIPSNYSARIANAASNDAKPAQINVTYNYTNSFLATVLGKEVMAEIGTTVSQTTSQQLTHSLLTGTQNLANGVRNSATASRKLHSGATDLAKSTTQLSSGLAQLSTGAGTLNGGASKVASGASELAGSLAPAKSQSAALSSGANALSGGVDKLASGLRSASSGSASLKSGLAQLESSSNKLSTGLSKLEEQTSDLPGQTKDLATGSAGVAKILATLQQLEAADPNMTLAQADAALAAAGGFSGAAGAASEVSSGNATLASQTPSLTSAIANAATGSKQITGGVAEAADGATNLNSGVAKLSDGAATAKQGASKVAAGTGKLASGVSAAGGAAAELASGSASVSSGAGELSTNSRTAASGAGQLDAGARTLSEKLGQFATTTSRGAKRAPHFTDQEIATVAGVVSAPVELSTHTLNEEKTYGSGFAPFFISLASFIGALISWMILRPLPSRPLGSNTSGVRHILTGYLPAAALSIAQVFVLVGVLRFGLGLRPAHMLGMILFIWLMCLTFLALQQMLIIVLGTPPGRLLSMVLLMLMLTSSGGTYPVQTTPAFFRAIHPFMPFSYSVTALRSLIAGGIQPRFWLALCVFVAIMVVSMAVSSFAAGRQKVWTMKRLHPQIQI